MNESFLKNAEILHKAIVSDDKQLFLKLTAETPALLGAVFGRFPAESLAVLYGSRKILAVFGNGAAEKTALPEYPEDYERFKKIAGRALRLYTGGKEVAPDEMRIMVGEETALRSENRLEKAYELSHGKTLKTDRTGAIVSPKSRAVTGDRRKILNIAITLTALFLVIAAALTAVSATVLGDGSALAPVRADSAEVLMNAMEDSDKFISLENDCTLELSADPELNFTGVLDGGGHTITVTGGYYGDPFCVFSGATVKDLTLKYDGFRAEYSGSKRTVVLERDFELQKSDFPYTSLQSDLFGNGHTLTVTGFADENGNFTGALFDRINGNVSDLKLDLGSNSEFAYAATTGLFCRVNNATISETEFVFSGTLHETNSDSDTYFGLLIGENRGSVSNVTATFNIGGDSDFDGKSESNNSYFGGIAGINYGKMINCFTSSDSTADTDTLDVSGIAGENAVGGSITGAVNRAAMTTTTATKDWSPNAAGITLVNRGDISDSYNYGALRADSTAKHDEPDPDSLTDVERGSTLIGGIAATNYGMISHSYNGGDIFSETAGAVPSIGGIVGRDTAESDRNTTITGCISDCTVTTNFTAAEPSASYYSIGGIAGIIAPQVKGRSSSINSCFSLNEFKLGNLNCGGIVGAISPNEGTVLIAEVGSAEQNLYLSDSGANSAVGLLSGTPVYFAGAENETAIKGKENFWYVAE